MTGIIIADIIGAILAMPAALFLTFWMSDVRNKFAVIAGAFVGVIIGFIGVLLWVGTFFHPQPLTDPVATFFGAIFICSVLGLAGGILTDLLVAGRKSAQFRHEIERE